MDTTGEKIKKMRLEKGLSLEDVHKKTKIHLNILRAIEGDSLTHLSAVYLQGFVKVYCKFLGLDSKEYIVETKETKRKVQEQAVVSLATNKPTPAAVGNPVKSSVSFDAALAKLGSLRPKREYVRAAVLVLVAAFALIGLFKLGKFISYKRRLARQIQSLPQRKTETKKASPTQKATQASAKTQTQEVKPLAKQPVSSQASVTASNPVKRDIASDIRLVIKARENCWVTLKTDGKLVFHRVLEKGRSESWKAKDKMELSLGNAGVVDLEVDGQLLSNLGRKGQALKSIMITKKGIDIGK